MRLRDTVRVTGPAARALSACSQAFTFDAVFGPNASQQGAAASGSIATSALAASVHVRLCRVPRGIGCGADGGVNCRWVRGGHTCNRAFAHRALQLLHDRVRLRPDGLGQDVHYERQGGNHSQERWGTPAPPLATRVLRVYMCDPHACLRFSCVCESTRLSAAVGARVGPQAARSDSPVPFVPADARALRQAGSRTLRQTAWSRALCSTSSE
jgi:hypothetical protein